MAEHHIGNADQAHSEFQGCHVDAIVVHRARPGVVRTIHTHATAQPVVLCVVAGVCGAEHSCSPFLFWNGRYRVGSHRVALPLSPILAQLT